MDVACVDTGANWPTFAFCATREDKYFYFDEYQVMYPNHQVWAEFPHLGICMRGGLIIEFEDT